MLQQEKRFGSTYLDEDAVIFWDMGFPWQRDNSQRLAREAAYRGDHYRGRLETKMVALEEVPGRINRKRLYVPSERANKGVSLPFLSD